MHHAREECKSMESRHCLTSKTNALFSSHYAVSLLRYAVSYLIMCSFHGVIPLYYLVLCSYHSVIP